MAELPSVPLNITTSEAPKSAVSPGQVAAPYQEMGAALDKIGEGLEKAAVPLAEQAGYQAVTRDAQGNVQVEHAPFIGPAAAAYSRAVKFAALAEGEGEAKRADISMRQQFRDNPEGYLAAADKFKDKLQKQYSDAAGPEVGIAMGKAVDGVTTQTYRGLLNEKERLDLQRAEASINTGIQSKRDDAVAMARGGDTTSPAFQQAVSDIKTLTQEKVNNPRLAYPADAAAYDLQHLDGELRANSALHHVDEVYNDKGVNDDGSARGGYRAALDAAATIRTDQSLKLTEQERNAYYSKAVGEIHANEAIRKQDIGEARAAEQSLKMVAAYGGNIAPEDIESVAGAYRAAGAPGSVARLYAWAARAPLGDDFGRQPIDTQTNQLNSIKGQAAAKQAYDFFTGRGYTPEQASGIVGNLAHESGLNPASYNPNDRGGPSAGLAQFHNERLTDLKAFAAAKGTSPTDFQTQLEFIDSELHGKEGATFARLQGAKTPEAAAAAFISYERPQGYTPENPSGGLGFQSRQNLARTVFEGQGHPATESNPAQSMWLAANHAKTLDTKAGQAWQKVMQDYTDNHIRPADETINQLTSAARATNNHDLLETIARGVDQMDIARDQSRKPLAQQQSDITEAEAAGNAGELTPGQHAVLKDLQGRFAAITNGLSENPIQTTVTNFSDKFATPAPLDLKNPDNLAVGLQQRGRIAQFAQQNWGGATPSALDQSDMNQVKAALDTPDPAVKANIFQAISTLPEQVRNATLAKIGEGSPQRMVSVFAGGLMSQSRDVAQSIIRGQSAMKTDSRNDPLREEQGAGGKAAFNGELDKVLPEDAFSLEGRTSPTGAYATMRGAIVARYADLMAQNPSAKKEFSSTLLKQASDDVTGGIVSQGGADLIAPVRGMKQHDFDSLMYGITDKDVAGVTTLNGQPLSPEYLRNSAQLEGVGQGRYMVRLGKDPMKPIYAFTGADTETPRPFILDLRNRPYGSFPVAQSGDVGQTP
jgi:tail lysozyme